MKELTTVATVISLALISFSFALQTDMTDMAKNMACQEKGYEYKEQTGSCYKFHGAAQTWTNALSTCRAEGGHLAIINSDTESTVLRNLYNKYAHTITGADQPKHALVGFRRRLDGRWVTVNDESLTKAGFKGWDQGEPSKGNRKIDESCGSIHRNGLLNDAPCTEKCPFICEITPPNNDDKNL